MCAIRGINGIAGEIQVVQLAEDMRKKIKKSNKTEMQSPDHEGMLHCAM